MFAKDNEICFCGSGKIYKRCCKGKVANSTPFYGDEVLNNPSRANYIMQERFKVTDFKICFAPDKENCILPIKHAHTLQNNGVLSLIAEDDHVMMSDIGNYTKDTFFTRKVSKNVATTFYGFCNYHDSALFKEIELKPYFKSKHQNFLFAYRACAQEYHKKLREIKSLNNIFRDQSSFFADELFIHSYRLRKLSLKDSEILMNIFNEYLKVQNYDILKTYIYEFNIQYDFAVTTLFNPSVDLNGLQLNDLRSLDEEILSSIFITFLPAKGKSYLIISCLNRDYNMLQSYFEQIKILDEDSLKILLNNILPEYSENIILSPRLWNKWTRFSKKEYEKVLVNIDFQRNKNSELNNPLRKANYNLFKI